MCRDTDIPVLAGQHRTAYVTRRNQHGARTSTLSDGGTQLEPRNLQFPYQSIILQFAVRNAGRWNRGNRRKRGSWGVYCFSPSKPSRKGFESPLFLFSQIFPNSRGLP